MAPISKLTRKEMNFKRSPWLTIGILKSMKSRDETHNKFLKTKDPLRKETLFRDFKNKRNLIVSLIRSSKEKYYNDFFIEYANNAKKLGKELEILSKFLRKIAHYRFD